MYLNINSECKYTHIYLINNTTCNFFLSRRASGTVLGAADAAGKAGGRTCTEY